MKRLVRLNYCCRLLILKNSYSRLKSKEYNTACIYLSMYKIIWICLILSGSAVFAQQVADSTFHYPIEQPAYKKGTGTMITIDEAHHNFHTMNGRYAPFARFLAEDGYQVEAGTRLFTESYLKNKKILVIANATDTTEWRLPTRTVFTEDEVSALKNWVNQGGSLFLIADHMPFPGNAENIAAAFGFGFYNGFALLNGGLDKFSRKAGNLHDHIITNGKLPSDKIDSIVGFTGQAFMAPAGAEVISSFKSDYRVYFPEIAWQINDSTANIPALGLAHSASLVYGKGRIVVVGEAAMFTAQLAGPQQQKVGMNHRLAVQNPRFLLNIIHWLDKKL